VIPRLRGVTNLGLTSLRGRKSGEGAEGVPPAAWAETGIKTATRRGG
jgi:hypothetical protein